MEVNWEAVGALGEIFGAVAVLVTLIYFSLQIKNMQSASIADSFARSEEGERELRALYISNIGLLLKANNNEILNDEELAVLNQLYGVCQSHHFHAFGRSTTLGGDGKIQARNFARALHENPCFVPIFKARNLSESRGPRVRAFNLLVENELDQGDV